MPARCGQHTWPFTTQDRPGGIRTPITRIWSPVLYRSSYWPTFPRPWDARNLALSLSGFPVQVMLTTEAAVFFEFESLRRAALVLCRRVVTTPTLDTRQGNQVPHGILLASVSNTPSGLTGSRLVEEPAINGPHPQARISLTTPAPTVRPPSRIAKRNSFSNAIGVINCTSTPTLSPGITISVPAGNVTTPVTSVVRK